MERESKIKYTIQVFSFLMQKTVFPTFSFPGGAVARRKVVAVLDVLEQQSGDCLSEERITDFCICQIVTIGSFGPDYLRRWNIGHSFGKKAIARFGQRSPQKKRFEDRWLHEYGLSRTGIVAQFQNREQHPLHKFIFPEYEENTKRRMQGTEVGYYICLVSTLLWTPFSPVCRVCVHQKKCKETTREKYPELFRIRVIDYRQ